MVQFNNELDEYDYYYHREVITSVNPLTPDHNDPLPHPPHLPTPVHAFSGAGGAALANFITYPLDLIQTRLQVQKQVQSHRRKMKRDRHRLQKGKQRDLSHSRSSTSSTSSVDSDSDDGVKVRRRGRRRTRASTVTEKNDSSDTGYMSAWELEYEQDETYDGVLDAAGKIFDKEGLSGLYRGVGWDTLGTVSGNLWYFLVYHLLRRQRMNILGPQHKHKPLPIAEELTIGIMSAALSRFVSSPLSNIVARKQTSAMLYPHARPPSIFDIYHDIMRENGVTGFWAGYNASFWLTLNPSLTFLLYETAKPHVREKNHGKLDGVESFFLAALCKAVATTVTYPLNVARARLQLEGTGKELDMEEMFHEPNINLDRGGTFNSRAKIRAAAVKAQLHRKQKIVKAKGLVDMLLYIVKKEGLSALYVGLGAELVKGFFTHGITMLAKEAVHKSILRLYYYILDLYNNSSFADSQRLEPYAAKIHDKVLTHAARREEEELRQQHHEHRLSSSPHQHESPEELHFRHQHQQPQHQEFIHEEKTWRESSRPVTDSFQSSVSLPPTQRIMQQPFRSTAAPKTVASVEKWMDRVEAETSLPHAGASPHAGSSSSAAPVKPISFGGLHGNTGTTTTTTTTTHIFRGGHGGAGGAGGNEIPKFVRDNSVMSGNTGRTSLNTGRTSLKVHPPRSVHEREWGGERGGRWEGRGGDEKW